MTARPNYTIWCDHDGCGNWTGSSHTPADSRREAKREGWTRKLVDGRRQDICNLHKEPRKEPKS